MDIISFNEAATANGRIEKFNANPDSNSGIVTVPKVIGAGENVTIPAGRVAVLPNVVIEGELNIEDGGEVFIPAGIIDRIGLIDYGYVAKPYHIVAFGGEFNRADYPKLWAYLQANPTLVKTQAQWQTEATANGGICGYFSDGNGTTTFRVPNLDKAFLRPDSRGVGSFENDSFQGHFHSITEAVFPSGTTSGLEPSAIRRPPISGFATESSSGPRARNAITDGVNGTPRVSNETRPKNIAVLPLVVAK